MIFVCFVSSTNLFFIKCFCNHNSSIFLLLLSMPLFHSHSPAHTVHIWLLILFHLTYTHFSPNRWKTVWTMYMCGFRLDIIINAWLREKSSFKNNASTYLSINQKWFLRGCFFFRYLYKFLVIIMFCTDVPSNFGQIEMNDCCVWSAWHSHMLILKRKSLTYLSYSCTFEWLRNGPLWSFFINCYHELQVHLRICDERLELNSYTTLIIKKFSFVFFLAVWVTVITVWLLLLLLLFFPFRLFSFFSLLCKFLWLYVN